MSRTEGIGKPVCGTIAHASADEDGPVKIGGKVSATLPTAVTDGDRVNAYYNEYGESYGLVSDQRYLFTAALTLDTAQYAAGDVLADILEITTVSRKAAGVVRLESVHVLDEDDQGAAFDIVLFNQTVSITGAKNEACATTDALMRNCQGIVRIASGDYVDLGANRLATIKNIGLILKPAATSIFVGTIS